MTLAPCPGHDQLGYNGLELAVRSDSRWAQLNGLKGCCRKYPLKKPVLEIMMIVMST